MPIDPPSAPSSPAAAPRRQRPVSLTGTLLLPCLAAVAVHGDGANRLAARLDSAATAVMSEMGTPGLALLLVQDGRPVHRRAYGVLTAGRADPATTASLFHLASVTKPFTAMTILQLEGQGVLDLDAPVTSYLPYFRRDDGAWGQVTVRQLLSHTGGVPDERDYGWSEPQTDDGALERYVRQVAALPSVAAPGAEFHYTNIGYSILGEVAAKASGKSFEDALQATVLEPLGMRRSSARLADVQADPGLTSPHTLDGRYEVAVSPVRPYSRPHAPSSTLYTSLDDMTVWILAVLDAATGTDGILTADLVRRMWEPPLAGSDAALGWFVGEHGGHRFVHHSGGDRGYAAFLALLPEAGAGVLVLANYERTPVRALAEFALDAALGRQRPVPGGFEDLRLDQILFETLRDEGADAAAATFERLRQAHAFDFNQVRQLLGLGRVLLDADRAAHAEVVYGLCLKLYPRLPFLHGLLADAHLQQADTAAAIRSYEEALRLDPEHEASRQALTRLLRGDAAIR